MKPKPTSHIVDALSLDRDATDKLLTWLTLETPAGVARVALSRDAVEQLWGMLDTLMAGWSCDCVDCAAERLAAERLAEEAEAAARERMH